MIYAATLAEATGLRWSLHLAKKMRYGNFRVELDAETDEIDNVISDYWNLISSMLNVSVVFISRATKCSSLESSRSSQEY